MVKWKFWENENSNNDAFNNQQAGIDNFSQNPTNNFDSNSLNEPSSFPPQQFGQQTFSENNQMQNQQASPFNDPINPSSQPDTFNKEFAQNNNGITNNNLEKDLMVINAKIDAIKATLESINQRIIKIERIAEGETQKTSPQRQQAPDQTQYRW